MDRHMCNIPKGFIDRAVGEAEEAFFLDRKAGEYHPAEHYFIIAAESIWNSYIGWKNQDSASSDRPSLTVRDIEFGCRRHGIPCHHDGDDLFVRMKNLTYTFIPLWRDCHGGPAGSEMKYLMNIFKGKEMRFSIGALFRFLKWFDNAIPEVRKRIDEKVDVFCHQFKRALILQAGAEQILEPGLENVAYRYSFRADDEDRLDIWIYYGKDKAAAPENVIRLSFRYEEYVRDPQFIKDIVKKLAKNYENISGYVKWATDLSEKNEVFPKFSGIKNAGVFAWHKKRE